MHYQDGTPAKVGDIVKGTTYNRPGSCVAIVKQLKPGSESCNATVGVLASVIEEDGARVIERVMNGVDDYTDTKSLTKVI